MVSDEKTFPTWGYQGSTSRLFDLKAGETLPEGWSDKPEGPILSEDDGSSDAVNDALAEITSLKDQLSKAQARIAELEALGQIEIPEDWNVKTNGANQKRMALARKLSPDQKDEIKTDEDAITIIQLELEARGENG